MARRLTDAEANFVRWARVARLATNGPDGVPHVVPVCPVLDGDRVLVASDDTAKLRNMRRDPRIALVFDDYVEEWHGLRRVLIQGRAEVVEGGPRFAEARRLLYEKFHQYEPLAPITEKGSVVIEVKIDRVVSDGF